ncbi:hypothetical protein [Actinoplanes sp. NPDC049265]|uniref:hypothetical protein n=1 Tax=Actinoplanes sp. NPDC049265 TaxID=3363902 RepID=UPI0037105E16
MSDHVELDRAVARSGADALFAAGEALGELLAGTRTTLLPASGAHPWGNDEIGHAFDAGYRPAEQDVLAAFEATARQVRTLGEQVRAVVAELRTTDQDAGVRVEHAYEDPA